MTFNAKKDDMRLGQVHIISIADCLQHLDIISRWHRAEWGVDWAEYIRLAILRDAVPTMYVAVYNGQPIGTSLLTSDDLPTRKDLSPWLAGVYVRPEWRTAGIGKLLAEHAMWQATVQKIPELFLFVHHSSLQSFYGKLGWKFFAEDTLYNNIVFVMSWRPEPGTTRTQHAAHVTLV